MTHEGFRINIRKSLLNINTEMLLPRKKKCWLIIILRFLDKNHSKTLRLGTYFFLYNHIFQLSSIMVTLYTRSSDLTDLITKNGTPLPTSMIV